MTDHSDLVARLRRQARICWSSAKIGAITKDRAASAMDEAAALIEAQAAEITRLWERLAGRDNMVAIARHALAEYACHGGTALPCIRSKEQCMAECGKIAGDALVTIETSLAIALGVIEEKGSE